MGDPPYIRSETGGWAYNAYHIETYPEMDLSYLICHMYMWVTAS